MTTAEIVFTIAATSLGTLLTRFLPFILFPSSKEPGKYIKHLGSVLPPAVIAMLVVYALRNISFADAASYLPALIATALTVALHLYKHNMLLSIACGTIVHMLLVQLVF